MLLEEGWGSLLIVKTQNKTRLFLGDHKLFASVLLVNPDQEDRIMEIPRALGLGGFYIPLAQVGSVQPFLFPRVISEVSSGQ